MFRLFLILTNSNWRIFPSIGYVLHWIKLCWIIIFNEWRTCLARCPVWFCHHTWQQRQLQSKCLQTYGPVCVSWNFTILVLGERWIVEGYWEQLFCKETSGSDILLGETTTFVSPLTWRDLMSVVRTTHCLNMCGFQVPMKIRLLSYDDPSTVEEGLQGKGSAGRKTRCDIDSFGWVWGSGSVVKISCSTLAGN